MRKHKPSRGEQNATWIAEYCVVPSGPDKGRPVRLTPAERAMVYWFYDNGPRSDVPVDGALAAYLALLHTVGIEATQKEFRPTISADIFTIWAACGEFLRSYLERKGERIVCPGLGTEFPAAA